MRAANGGRHRAPGIPVFLLPVLLGFAVVLAVGVSLGRDAPPPEATAPAPGPTGPAAIGGTGSGQRAPNPPAPASTPQIVYPQEGDGDFVTAPGGGAVAGTSGRLLRYRVAVEFAIRSLDVVAFADEVSTTLADRRGWTAGGSLRLQRVGEAEPADFTVYLATPGTRDVLCGSGFDRYTSCRNGDKVVLNVARWVLGVPPARGDLRGYRQYLVNHEVGHRLGHGHQRCPGAGRPAPVMQQQSLGLHGCLLNGWPYLDGALHSGPAGEYDDPIPTGPVAGPGARHAG